jgi:hypothetical protein
VPPALTLRDVVDRGQKWVRNFFAYLCFEGSEFSKRFFRKKPILQIIAGKTTIFHCIFALFHLYFLKKS